MADTRFDYTEITVSPRLALLAATLLLLPLLGAVAYFLVPRLLPASSPTVTLRCLPTLHVSGTAYLLNQAFVDDGTPTPVSGIYAAPDRVPCEVAATTHVLARAGQTACLITLGAQIAPGQSATLACAPVPHGPALATTQATCLATTATYYRSDVRMVAICTLWVEAVHV